MADINIPSFQDENVLIYNDFFMQEDFMSEDDMMYGIDHEPVQASEPYQVDEETQTGKFKKAPSGPTGDASNEYDIINTFFKQKMNNDTIADVFTMYLFKISKYSQTPVMSIMDTMKDQDKMAVTSTMAYFLNKLRSKHVLFGVHNIITPNHYSARNIVM